MTKPNSSRPKSNTGKIKLFITSLSLATTLSGWALLGLQAPTTVEAFVENDNASELEVAAPPTASASAFNFRNLPDSMLAERRAMVVGLPRLSELPVRGLRRVGDPVIVIPKPNAPDAAPVAQPTDVPPPDNSKEKAARGERVVSPPNPQPPKAAQPSKPDPQPKPKPKTKTKGSN